MNTIDYSPESWGWKPEFLASWASLLDERPELSPLVPARVTRREHHLYEIARPDFSGRHPAGIPARDDGGAGTAESRGLFGGVRVSGRFEYGAGNAVDYPVVGDWVLVDGGSGTPRIHATFPRRTALSRGSAGPRCDEQTLAANVDVIFLVFALDGGRNFLPRFLERALVVARNSGAAPCVVLNKADLAADGDRADALRDARAYAPQANVVALSAKTGEGVGDLARFLSPGETACMLGKSGVGKSALVNALGRASSGDVTSRSDGAPRDDGSVEGIAREGRVREDDLRGRHTTTSSRLYRFDSGVLLIDSPGIRELKVWGEADVLEGGFPEIAELATQCRFSDCSHADEPGCAVRAALATGELDNARFLSYLALSREQAWLERRNDDRARRENDQKWKQISKLQKELKKNRS